VSDIDTVVVDSLKVLDQERPIREATLAVHCGISNRSMLPIALCSAYGAQQK
jgi:hypothetical protein